MLIEKASLDPRSRFYIQPNRIVWQTSDNAAPKNSDLLLQPGSGQATLWARQGCILKNDGIAPGIVLDFGIELNGGVQIIVGNVGDSNKTRVRVRFGESVSEAMGDPNNDHAFHDNIIHVAWAGATEIGNTGFRFVRIDLIDKGTEVELKEIRAVALMRDLPWKGSFSCSDERLNTIWKTGAHTVHLNMQDYVWDGVKRDRLVWIGDMHPEALAISTVFGEVDVVPKSLNLIRDETELPLLMNNYSAYSLWWIIIQHHWYLNHGNLEYLKAQHVYLAELMVILEGYVDDQNREILPDKRFLDWPTARDPEVIHAGLQSLMVLAFSRGAELCGILNDESLKIRCMQTVDKLKKHIPEAGLNKQCNALKVLAGLADAKETNSRILAKDQLEGLSTFYGYYVLQARSAAGDYEGCLEVIRKYWGAMIDLGATSFWEDFNLHWADNAARIDQLVPEGKGDVHAEYGDHCYVGLRHSLCHGWASGPTSWLSEHILGFKPLKPGCAELAIDGHLEDLEWAEGTYPTPRGIVHVRHKKGSNGKIETKVDAPEDIHIVAGSHDLPPFN